MPNPAQVYQAMQNHKRPPRTRGARIHDAIQDAIAVRAKESTTGENYEQAKK